MSKPLEPTEEQVNSILMTMDEGFEVSSEEDVAHTLFAFIRDMVLAAAAAECDLIATAYGHGEGASAAIQCAREVRDLKGTL